ncbi:MFS transporter [Acinetobacter sp. ANC 4558]|uniref:MFS transporter n=1 Tax=Acinetobacter sp. ANC 4558 TaxID=1977876 RepID=UPI001D174C6F|nr:MFS transporter [Acinetobacter sp. ANC 4558]
MEKEINSIAGQPAEHMEVPDQATKKVIFAASVGTVFEWYEFTLYGALAAVIALNFFSGLDPSTGFIFALLIFAVGFIMRPVGAVVFGRIGDKLGRKKTFMITVIIMGISTVIVGLLPTYNQIGIWAPLLLITMRMIQGLALGGEYGGAATYVAEHSTSKNRGLNTSWISATGTLGLLLAFAVIMISRWLTGDEFNEWGWRIPFLFSLLLLLFSIKIRKGMDESPAFKKMQKEKTLSKSPLRDTFLDPTNIKRLLIAFFGICGGMTCAYYIAVLYPTFFLTQILKVDPQIANSVVTISLIAGIPMFLFSGWLSDRIGRKKTLLIGFTLTALVIFPIFKGVAYFANPSMVASLEKTPIYLNLPTEEKCSFMFNPTGTRQFTKPCDLAKQALANSGLSYTTVQDANISNVSITVGNTHIENFQVGEEGYKETIAKITTNLKENLAANNIPTEANADEFRKGPVIALLIVLVWCGLFTLTPVAPALLEMFPAKIRYTSMSFPYHFASGWVGGLLPTIAFAISIQTGNIYFGLWYPVCWIVLSLFVCLIFFKETKNVDINK